MSDDSDLGDAAETQRSPFDGPQFRVATRSGPGAAGSHRASGRQSRRSGGPSAGRDDVAPAGESADGQGDARPTRRDRRQRRKAPWWELPALVIAAIVIAILVKSFVVQPFYIPSDSMERTLHGCPGCHGDRILVSKLSFDVGTPSPGDIVVFHAPPGWPELSSQTVPPSNPVLRGLRDFGQLVGFVPPDGEILVKRVIAVGGQTIRGFADGRVQVSDSGATGPYRTLDEPFTDNQNPRSPQRPFGPVTIPAGRLWVMGDHRTDSADSRFHCLPNGEDSTDDSHCSPTGSTVPVGDVIGKAVVIAWPPSRWRTLGTPATFADDHQALGQPVTGSDTGSATGSDTGSATGSDTGSATRSAAGPSGAGASALPLLAGAALVAPVAVLRRRRRGRPTA